MRNFHFLSLGYYILLGHVAIFNANIGKYGFIGSCMILKYRLQIIMISQRNNLMIFWYMK